MQPEHDLTIAATDGYRLAATRFGDDQPGAGLIVIGAATAVPRGYYARFARYLAAAAGVPVLTFDYRGIGGSRPASLKGFKARMRDWGERDCAGILAWAEMAGGGGPIRWIGHSYGGFGPALAENNHLVARVLAIATMSGHWGRMRGLDRLRVGLLMGAVVPAAARVMGHAPGWLIGGAEDLPRGVALEFSRWCKAPGFFFDDETLQARARIARFAAPMLFCRAADDGWCTEAAQRHMMDGFVSARHEPAWVVDPAMAGGPVGHVGFFRERYRDTLWPRARDWIMRPAASHGTSERIRQGV